MANRCKLYVINENTLAYDTGVENYVGVLAVSVIKGSRFKECDNGFICESDVVRLATEKDFDEFRVVFKGFSNPSEYEFDVHCVGCGDKLHIDEMTKINDKYVCEYCKMRNEQYKELKG